MIETTSFSRQMRRYPIRQQMLFHLPLLLMLAWCFDAFESEVELLRVMAEYREACPFLTKTLSVISHIGSIPFYVFYLGIGIVAVRNRDRNWLSVILGVIVSLPLSLILVRSLKYAISRPRPSAPWFEFAPFSNPRSAFPSSHLTESLVAILPLALRFNTMILPIVLGVFPALVGFSRLLLGRHYPSDLCGSMVVGFICSWVAWRVVEICANRQRSSVQYSSKTPQVHPHFKGSENHETSA